MLFVKEMKQKNKKPQTIKKHQATTATKVENKTKAR